jgi:hypothetical protein
MDYREKLLTRLFDFAMIVCEACVALWVRFETVLDLSYDVPVVALGAAFSLSLFPSFGVYRSGASLRLYVEPDAEDLVENDARRTSAQVRIARDRLALVTGLSQARLTVQGGRTRYTRTILDW